MSISIENSGKKILIAIIDSGIETSVSDLSNYIIKSTGFRINSEGFISELPNIRPNGLHGTSVALIIRDICRNVELISINILNDRMSTDSRIMIYAMNEALKYEPDIIHMSLGTTNRRYRSYLKKIVGIANKKNIVIVAASNNNGFWSYPACIKGVVGVKSAKNDENPTNHFYKKNRYYYAPFTMQGIEGKEELLENAEMIGTSMAAAYVTGGIANIKSKQKLNRFENISKILKNKINRKII